MKKKKKNISILKTVNFKIETVIILTEVDFLDVTFNLENNTYRPYRKPNDKLIYIDIFITPAVIWEVLRTAKAYSNITKRCSLCFHEKLVVITYSYPDELLKKRSDLVTKCRREDKILLKNFNSND